jgi:hypothetical protein
MSMTTRLAYRRLPRLLAALLLLGGLTVPQGARAEGDDSGPVKPAPRTSVQVGGVSVVLISSGNKLLAFVDRLEDNVPAADAKLTVMLADGSDLKLERAADGLFVAPFDRTGRMRDTFMVSVRSAAGTGDEGAEIVYDDVPAPTPTLTPDGLRDRIGIALVAAAIGAIGASVVIRWQRNRRRVGTGHPAPVA